MTYPVNPSTTVHTNPNAGAEAQAQAQALQNSISNILTNLPGELLESVTNAILNALGWGPTQSGSTVNQMASNLNTALTQIAGQVQQAATNISALISTAEGQTIADLVAWLNNLESNANSAVQNIENFLSTGNWSSLTAAWNNVLQGLFGTSSTSGILSSVPSTAVTNVTQSLQPVWTFPNAISISSNSDWSWDGTTDHSYAYYNVANTGSAKVTANGTVLTLDGVPCPVQPGQVVTPQAWVKWTGLSSTGAPIQVQIIPWSGTAQPGSPGTPVTIGTPPSSLPAAQTWTELTGTYTVPQSGVGFVQISLVVGSTATAGTVWFDDCAVNVAGGYLAGLQDDITSLQQDSQASTQAFATFISSVESAITGYTSWNTFIANLESAWQTYATTEAQISASATFTLQNFFNTLLGVSPTTGQISGTNVSSSTGSTSSLSQDVTELFQPFSSIASLTSPQAWKNAWSGLEGLLGIPTSTMASSSPPTQISSAQITSSLGGSSTSIGTDVSSVHSAAAAAAAAATTAGTNASMAITQGQAITDGIYQASNGGTSTGNSTSTVVTSLTAIPASNIVGQQGAAVTYGATGGGNASSSSSISWTHTIGATDLGVVAIIAYDTSSGASPSSTVTYGGAAMTLLKQQIGSSEFGNVPVIEAWWMKNPPGGSQTVSVSVTNAGTPSGDTVSYYASKTGGVNGATGGSNASLSMSAASSSNNRVIGAFTQMANAATSWSGYSQTSRYSTAVVHLTPLIIGDAPGSNSVAFSVNSGSSANQWCGITVELEN